MEAIKPSYKTLPLADDYDGSEVSTEVDEALMSDEHQWHSKALESAKYRRHNTWTSKLRSYRWLVDTFLLFIILMLLVILLLRNDSREGWRGSGLQIGGDYKGAGPIFTTKVVKWEADMSFVPENTTDFFSNNTLARWNTLMPAGTGRDLTADSFSTTSMTHQLHCLFMMGRIYSGVLDNTTDILPKDWHSHFLHCIDYLRQAITCSADLTLELHTPSDADDLGPLDGGWNGHHVCKDYSQVVSYLEDQIATGSRTLLAIDD